MEDKTQLECQSSKLISRFNTSLVIIPALFSADMDKLTLKYMWKDKGTRAAKDFEKEEQIGSLTLHDKTYYKVTVIETVWFWRKIDIYVKGIEYRVQK